MIYAWVEKLPRCCRFSVFEDTYIVKVYGWKLNLSIFLSKTGSLFGVHMHACEGVQPCSYTHLSVCAFVGFLHGTISSEVRAELR
jgi:hypothetical protein